MIRQFFRKSNRWDERVLGERSGWTGELFSTEFFNTTKINIDLNCEMQEKKQRGSAVEYASFLIKYQPIGDKKSELQVRSKNSNNTLSDYNSYKDGAR